MPASDYYSLLGVAKDATADQIKKAFRKLAVKYHPDKTAGDKQAEDKFKQINEAYDVLSDPEKRKKYDALGENWKYYDQAQAAGGQYAYGNPGQGNFNPDDFMHGGEGDFSDFFGQFFGGRGGRSSNRPRSGSDSRASLTISLDEAFHGVTKTIDLNGQPLNLKLKPGIADGQTLRLKGRGSAGLNGGPAGDLLLTINVTGQPGYERRGDDLYIEQPVNALLGIAGGKVIVETLHKKLSLTIPPKTDSGKTFRLKGQGMPRYDKPGEWGDAFVRVSLVSPTNLSQSDLNTIQDILKRTNG